MKMTDDEFNNIQQMLQENGNILVLQKDDGHITGFISYSVKIKNNLYVNPAEHHINVTNDFITMVRNILKKYKVDFNSTRTTFWLSDY